MPLLHKIEFLVHFATSTHNSAIQPSFSAYYSFISHPLCTLSTALNRSRIPAQPIELQPFYQKVRILPFTSIFAILAISPASPIQIKSTIARFDDHWILSISLYSIPGSVGNSPTYSHFIGFSTSGHIHTFPNIFGIVSSICAVSLGGVSTPNSRSFGLLHFQIRSKLVTSQQLLQNLENTYFSILTSTFITFTISLHPPCLTPPSPFSHA